MRVISLFLLMTLCIFTSASFGQDEIIELIDSYTARDIYIKAVELAELYPDIISIEIIGYSEGSQPIFVIHVTEQPQQVAGDRRVNVNKMNFFVEGGIHSRENVSPVMLLKITETYARDYYNDSVIEGVSVKDYLANNVIHILPLTNPDGYNLANFGLYSLNNTSQKKVESIKLMPYRDIKSNISGVDLNRNFPGVYYNIETDRFEDVWNVKLDEFVSSEPSGAFYSGPNSGSEIETRVLMNYIEKYDFRNYLSFHSRGEVIYYYKWMLSETHNQHSINLANAISGNRGNQYNVYLGDDEVSSSGYLTDFSAMMTLKPSLTIESVPGRESLPTNKQFIEQAYRENLYVILQGIDHSRGVGYFSYHLYVDNKYVRDYEEKEYAEAMAKYYGGVIYESNEKPLLSIPKSLHYISRLELLQYVMMAMEYEVVPHITTFDDSNNFFVTQAKNMDLVSGSNSLFRPNDVAMAEEAYVLLAKAFAKEDEDTYNLDYSYDIPWAELSLNKLLTMGIVEENSVIKGPISLEHLENMINATKK